MASGLQTNKENLIRMKQFAASDANHDFGKNFLDLYNKKSFFNIGTPLPLEKIEPVYDSWDLLASFTTNSLRVKDLVLNQPVKFTSKTGIEYDVCAFDAHDLEKIMPFLYNSEAGVQGEANIIFDAFASSFWEDLRERKGPSLGRLNILTNRETINDPATKVSPTNTLFAKNDGRSVTLFSYQDTAQYSIFYPAWMSPRTDYHNDFFSNFYLNLSQVTFDATQLITTIDFGKSADDMGPESFTIATGGPDINSITAINQKLYEFSNNPDKASPENAWKFGLYLQQKRSGDSLQMLSAMDVRRKYNERTPIGLGKELDTLRTSYTYVGTNDIWNTAYGILVGANIICLTNEGNRIYVFRTGIPSDPRDIFVANGPSILRDHNLNITKHQVLFNLIAMPLQQEYLLILQEFEKYIRIELDKEIPSNKAQQTTEENTLNSILKNIMRIAFRISILYEHFQPMPYVEDTFEIIIQSPASISKIIEEIRKQKVIQVQNIDDLNTKFRSALINEPILDTILFFNSYTSYTSYSENTAVQNRSISFIYSSLALLAKLKLDISEKTFELLRLLNNSKYIQKRYQTFSSRKSFSIIFQSFFVAYEDIVLYSATPSLKRKRSDSNEVPRVIDALNAKSYLDIHNALLYKAMLDTYLYSLSIQTQLSQSAGYKKRKTQKKQRGGNSIPLNTSFNGNFFIQRQLNLVFLPIAANILIGETEIFKTGEEDAFIKYILIGLLKFINHRPPYEQADHISLWGPVFVDMIQQVLEDKEPTTKRIKLQFFLGIWLQNTPRLSFNLPEESWTAMPGEAGQTLLEFIFGSGAELLKTIEIPDLSSIMFKPDIRDYKSAYTSSSTTIVSMLDSLVFLDTSESLIAEPVAATTSSGPFIKNIISKSLSIPSASTVSVVDRDPTLIEGSFSSSSKTDNPTSSGGYHTRKIVRKTLKNSIRVTRRHRKIRARRV
jgi:hypothetical protein